jgi:hypothetical protein
VVLKLAEVEERTAEVEAENAEVEAENAELEAENADEGDVHLVTIRIVESPTNVNKRIIIIFSN